MLDVPAQNNLCGVLRYLSAIDVTVGVLEAFRTVSGSVCR